MNELNVRSIVRSYLAANGYEGLAYCDDWDGCGCGLDDLIACEESCHNCKPAYAVHWDTCPARLSEDGCWNAHTAEPAGGCTCWSTEKPKEQS